MTVTLLAWLNPAAFDSSSRTCDGCDTTGNGVWFYEDFDVADEFNVAVETVGPFGRTGEGVALPGSFVATAFEGAVGDVSLTPAPDGFVIGYVAEVVRASPSMNST